MLWSRWSRKLPGTCGTARAVRWFSLTRSIQRAHSSHLTKCREGLNCKKLARRICPSRNVSSELGEWPEVSRNIAPGQLNQQPGLHGVYGLVVRASLAKNEHEGKCKPNERPSPVSFTPAVGMTFQSTSGIQNSRLVSIWGPMSNFPTCIVVFWQGKTRSFLLHVFMLL